MEPELCQNSWKNVRKHIYSTVKRRKGKGILEKEGNRDEREGRE
jgi:hypothetical protein